MDEQLPGDVARGAVAPCTSAAGEPDVAAAMLRQVGGSRAAGNVRAARAGAAAQLSREALWSKVGLCGAALAEARRLAAASRYEALFSQVLHRVVELLDEIDEILLRLQPARDHDAFARVARLHRDLEDVLARTPREHRRLRREALNASVAPALRIESAERGSVERSA